MKLLMVSQHQSPTSGASGIWPLIINDIAWLLCRHQMLLAVLLSDRDQKSFWRGLALWLALTMDFKLLVCDSADFNHGLKYQISSATLDHYPYLKGLNFGYEHIELLVCVRGILNQG